VLVESTLKCSELVLSGFDPFLSGGELALGGAIRDGDPTIAAVGTERHLVHFAEAMLLTGPAVVIDGVGILCVILLRQVLCDGAKTPTISTCPWVSCANKQPEIDHRSHYGSSILDSCPRIWHWPIQGSIVG
jgi:hypothetical protein